MNDNILEVRPDEKDWREMTIRERTEKGVVMFTSEWNEEKTKLITTQSSYARSLLAKLKSESAPTSDT